MEATTSKTFSDADLDASCDNCKGRLPGGQQLWKIDDDDSYGWFCSKDCAEVAIQNTCPYCLVDGKALTAALDQCIETLEHISSWRLKSEMSSIGPDHTNKDELLDLAITLARAALGAAKKVRG